MARPRLSMGTRQIVPRFWDNEELADLEKNSHQPKLRLTLIGLWAASDAGAGRFEWRPRTLASKIFPFNEDDRAAMETIMDLLEKHKFLVKYRVGDKLYGMHPHWGEHNDFRKSESPYPPPPGGLVGVNPLESPAKPLEVEVEGEGEERYLTATADSTAKLDFEIED